MLELIAASGAHLPGVPGPGAINEWFLRLPAGVRDKPAWLTRAGPATLDLAIAGRLEALERALGRPAANKRLPFEARLDEVRGWLRLGEELARLRDAVWTTAHEPEVAAVLRALGAAVIAAAAERDARDAPDAGDR